MRKSGVLMLAGLCLAGTIQAAITDWPELTSPIPRDAAMETRIATILKSLTLEQKVAQMVQADIRSVTPEDVRKYRLGAIQNGGGAWPANNKNSKVADWVALADQFYDASMDTSTGAPAIPVFWGTDAVHGHNNVIGATLFPHNIGLGAAHDPDLMQRIGEITAEEVSVTGINWAFAPTVAVVRDARWGRTYEGYSEDPEIVRSYAARIVRGLQGTPGTPGFLDSTHVISTAKHYVGDGGTESGIDHAENCASEHDLVAIHGQGHIAAVQAGVQMVMVSYNSWAGIKMHGQRYLLTDVLKGRLGFDGVIISDWNGIDEVQGCTVDRCARAVNAGIDIFMEPENWKSFIWNTVALVRTGEIPESRIDDAVTRILRVKMRARLFETGRPSSHALANKTEILGAADHREVARQAVRESLVLMKNESNLLPLRPKLKVLVAGDGADNIPKQSGGWSISWQGTGNSNADFPGGTSIFAGIHNAVSAAGGQATLSVDGHFTAKPDVAIVVFGEEPYAEWYGDIDSLSLSAPHRLNNMPAPEGSEPGEGCRHPKERPGATEMSASVGANLALLRNFKKQGIPVVSVFLTGRPLAVPDELDASAAFVVAWLPGTEGAGVADVLFRKADGRVNHDFTGKLSYTWPRMAGDGAQFPFGFGLSYGKLSRQE